MTPARGRRRRTDARLVLPALAAWAGSAVTALALSVPVDAAARRSTAGLVAAAAGAGVVAGLAAVALLLRRTRRGVLPTAGAVGLVLAVLGAGAGALTAALHAAALSAPAVADAADARAVVTATGAVVGDARRSSPRPSGAWRADDRWQVRLRLETVNRSGTVTAVDVPLLVRLPVGDREPPEVGERLVLRGRLRPPPPLADVAAVLTAEEARVDAGAGAVDGTANRVRAGLRRSLDGAPPDAAALVAGLAVGDESTAPADLADAMRRSGLSHLTAVSGGNVAVVLLAVLALARGIGLRSRGRAVAAALALAGFVVLVRPQPSVLRAAAMGAVLVVALVAGGRRTGLPALAAAVLGLVLVSPPLSVAYGFALSVAATAGLLVLLPRLRTAALGARPLARWPPALLDALLVTTAAQVATAPLIAGLGSGIGLAALPANLLAAPAVAPVTVLGLAAALLSPLLPGLAVLPARLAAVPAGGIALVARAAAAAPLASVPWPSGVLGALSLTVVGAGIAAGLHRARRRQVRLPRGWRWVGAVLAAGAVVVIALRPPGRAGWPPPGWVLVVCDVGQGDALALRAGEGAAVVVDAGPDPGAIDRCLADAGVVRVPAVLLTHFHADHVEGLPGVLRGRSVGAVLATPLREPGDEAARVDAWLAPRGLAVTPVALGERRAAGEVRWQVVWPRRVLRGQESIPNNASVVLLAEVDGVRLLLGADVEPAAQRELVRGVAPPHVDVVKVPHHGSRFQDVRLPTWSGGRLALISVGSGNDYGHPAAATVDAWRRTGALVARTDVDGDLAVVREVDGGIGLVTRR